MKIKLLEPIEGYEDVAEVRMVKAGEWYLRGKDAKRAGEDHERYEYPVLTPIERWRPATLSDVVKVFDGKDVKARFSVAKCIRWKEGLLGGVQFTKDGIFWNAKGLGWFGVCEVCDES